ncbi:HAD-superfamily hydrolase, subfamily IA [Candidatus Burkholderia pumila]|uniref:HAD-superfamily hydrolase, subfamily IA n=1 Tax=Candidatus Burkholderia pumila TaxID=1090375 RepID=A0ABR5HKN7_9BURK|nr:HAD-superfamily hydrolase, subfamily IA [Candidatus Burkholderia pumila]
MESVKVVFFDVSNTLMNFDYGTVAKLSGMNQTQLTKQGPARWKQINSELAEAHRRGEQPDPFRMLIHSLVYAETGLAGIEAVINGSDAVSLWNCTNDEARQAVEALRSQGVRAGVISKSKADGTLQTLLDRHGWMGLFEVVIDSTVVGVQKPDSRIFEMALARVGVKANEALYVGYLPSVDVQGANDAGLRAVLYDPYDLYQADLEHLVAAHGPFHRLTDLRQLSPLVRLLNG